MELRIDGADGDATIALAHGAGAAMDSDWMEAITAALVDEGLRVVRFEFPYMRRRRQDGKRRGPDRPPVLLAAWREVIDHLADRGPLVIGGKSMGGRIASMVADDDRSGKDRDDPESPPEPRVAGLVCMGYPFHPPRAPDKLRTAHLADLRTPTLILQGTRDPFGTPDEVTGYDLSPAIRVHWLEDGDHSFKPRVRSGRTLQQNMAAATHEIVGFVGRLR